MTGTNSAPSAALVAATTTNTSSSSSSPSSSGFQNPWPYTEVATVVGEPRRQHTHEGAPLPALFRPLKIRNLTLKNRIAVSPMCMYSCLDGFLTDFHLVHLGQFALGGAALVIQEATAVEPRGRISPYCAGLWKDEHIAPTKRVVDFLHANGCAAGIQLGHAGRKASTFPPFMRGEGAFARAGAELGWPEDVVGPSAIAFDKGWIVPHALTVDEIHAITHQFELAIHRAIACGFDVVEIHGAHGYLISSFLSPVSNQRTDEYGGSFENRIRLLMEIVAVVRRVWPADRPLSVRISATEWTPDGWQVEDSVRLTELLIKAGVDIVDPSTGGNDPRQQIPLSPGYQVPMSIAIKQKYKHAILTSPVGLITDAKQANDIVEQGQGDLVLLAREFLRNPHFPLYAAAALGAHISSAPQYSRAPYPAHL